MAFYEKVFGWLAYCSDSAGNGFGIMQADESATS
jgi:predicted enzyme related to lactoylglutathione lyase